MSEQLRKAAGDSDTPITHEQAMASAQRLINSFFQRSDSEKARAGIPARPGYDDDLVICQYIREQEALSRQPGASGGGARAVCGEVYQVVGVLADMAGVFQDEQTQRVIANLDAAAHGELIPYESVLPFNPAIPSQGGEQIERAAKVIRSFWQRHPDAPEPCDDHLSLSLDLAQEILSATPLPQVPGGVRLLGVVEGSGDYSAKAYGEVLPDGTIRIDRIETDKPDATGGAGEK